MVMLCFAASVAMAAPPSGKPSKKGGGKGNSSPFQLVAFDNFENGADTWPTPGVQRSCSAGDTQLGVFGIYGSGSVLPLSKTYTIETVHTHVRIQATVAFLDEWQGEAASLKVEDEVVWSDSWHHCPKIFSGLCMGVSVCGDSLLADRLGRRIDVIVPHSGSLLTLTFETALNKGSNASFLVDDIRISVF